MGISITLTDDDVIEVDAVRYVRENARAEYVLLQLKDEHAAALKTIDTLTDKLGRLEDADRQRIRMAKELAEFRKQYSDLVDAQQAELAEARKPYADKIMRLEAENAEIKVMNSELNESHTELIRDYQTVLAVKERLQARVHDLEATREPQLNEFQWEALAAAEKPLYIPFMGCHAFTDVMERQDGQLAAHIWGQAEMAIECSTENWDDKTDRTQTMYIAQRVARCLALISFGPDFLLK